MYLWLFSLSLSSFSNAYLLRFVRIDDGMNIPVARLVIFTTLYIVAPVFASISFCRVSCGFAAGEISAGAVAVRVLPSSSLMSMIIRSGFTRSVISMSRVRVAVSALSLSFQLLLLFLNNSVPGERLTGVAG